MFANIAIGTAILIGAVIAVALLIPVLKSAKLKIMMLEERKIIDENGVLTKAGYEYFYKKTSRYRNAARRANETDILIDSFLSSRKKVHNAKIKEMEEQERLLRLQLTELERKYKK